MKDGSAHPTDPTLARSGDGERWAPIRAPRVSFHEQGDDERAAVELERIVNRYAEKLPSPGSREAREIEFAAQLLYAELYRDCGQEARRQKLRGLQLLRRFIKQTIEQAKPKSRSSDNTAEQIDRWRAYIVADLMELGVNQTESVFCAAAEIAKREGWPLGKESSFKAAYYRWKNGPDWLESGVGREGYRTITKSDLEGIVF